MLQDGNVVGGNTHLPGNLADPAFFQVSKSDGLSLQRVTETFDSLQKPLSISMVLQPLRHRLVLEQDVRPGRVTFLVRIQAFIQ